MPKILLVEDASDLAQLIARELRAARYEVAIADNGVSALQQHADQRPDLVILDWILPEMDGLEVLRRLRQTSGTPVLMLTGRDEEIDRVVGLEVGADDYLVKPFSMRELLARTRAMLRRAEHLQRDREPENRVFRYHNISLDPTAHIVTLEDHELDLSRTEFDLLHLFIRHPGQVFARADLLERIWHAAYSGQDRAVDYAIHRLRRKLESMGDCIETIHGVGYRFGDR
jgi:DNA-binding response OmpR family regulator